MTVDPQHGEEIQHLEEMGIHRLGLKSFTVRSCVTFHVATQQNRASAFIGLLSGHYQVV